LKYGADNIRIGLKEKYLGRKPGTRRGESETQYSSHWVSIIMSISMLGVLAYV